MFHCLYVRTVQRLQTENYLILVLHQVKIIRLLFISDGARFDQSPTFQALRYVGSGTLLTLIFPSQVVQRELQEKLKKER